MRSSPLTTQDSLTFDDYFELNVDIEELLTHFGYTFQSVQMTLPRSDTSVHWYPELRERIQAGLPYISLTSEAARREFLIAPIFLDLARYNQIKVKVEFPIEVSNQLKGTIDYFIQSEYEFLVVEAKNADLQRGFTQLAAEMVAVDHWTDEQRSSLYGAVSIGNVWQFSFLDRENKQFTQDLNLYRVPADLHELLQILLAILEPGAIAQT
ncbi:MAG: hypothetical protein AAGF95_09700 [Chloroflexota bacterium]